MSQISMQLEGGAWRNFAPLSSSSRAGGTPGDQTHSTRRGHPNAYGCTMPTRRTSRTRFSDLNALPRQDTRAKKKDQTLAFITVIVTQANATRVEGAIAPVSTYAPNKFDATLPYHPK